MIHIDHTIYCDQALLSLRNNNLTEKMVHLHEQMVDLLKESNYERKMRALEQQHYKRNISSGVGCPTIDSIEAELELLKDVVPESYSVSKIYDERVCVWEELNAFSEKVEDFVESVENQRIQSEYCAAQKNQAAYSNGNEDMIKSWWNDTLQSVSIPFDVKLSLAYDQIKKEAVLDIELPNNLNLPVTKIVSHTRGCTMKDKLQREIAQETAECQLGLMFLLANRTYRTTPNMDYLLVKLWTPGQKAGLVAMDFERGMFEAMVLKDFVPSSELFKWKHVSDNREVRGAMVCNWIVPSAFNRRCEELVTMRV